MVTGADYRLAQSMRSLGRAMLDLANEIDPPYPCGPFDPGTTCVGAGGWPGFVDQEGVEHPSCEDSCSAYQKWLLRQDK